MSNCVGTRFLEKGETLLYDQTIVGTEEVDADKLDNLYRQEPNSRIPLLPIAPYVGVYQYGLNRYNQEALRDERDSLRTWYDSALAATDKETRKYKRLERRRRKKLNRLDKAISEGNLYMRWGEKLEVYDENQAIYTAQQMEQFLFNRGYFQAEVTYKAKTRRKRTRITYRVEEGSAHVIDSLSLITRDTALAKLYRQYQDESLLKVGDNYDAEAMESERNRIDALLKDHGYYAFSRNYVSFEVDSTSLDNRRVILRTLIRTPQGQNAHKVYRIDSVVITTDANLSQPRVRNREVHNDIIYRYYESQYSKRILERRIFLYPDSLYSRSKTLATQRQLANLDNFKFINIKYDTLGGAFTARVYMSPLPKRQISDEIGLVVSQGIPGPLVNVTFTNRNVFKHLENLQTSGRFSIEGVPAGVDEEGNTENGTSTEASANMSLYFPQFLIPVSNSFKRRLGYANPRTRAQIGYAYNRRPQYTRNTVNAAFVYTWETNRGTRYSYSLLDLGLINSPVIRDDFQAFLDQQERQGNALKRTFEPSLVSGSQISATYNFLGQESSQQKAAYLRALVDVGGTIWNVIDPELVTQGDLQVFQYLKFNTDFIRYRPIGDDNVLAYRFNVGVAGSYGENNILPFEKYFFAGGSNSIRAWAPRRLGPGSYSQTDQDGNLVANFDQQGEILLASSVEWRTPIVGYIDGALFLDVGNIWMLQEDEAREGAQFQFNRFWREFAVGTGLGIRADFSFLILRVDLGIKIHDPALNEGERWFYYDYFDFQNLANHPAYTLNLGIGYPF